MTIFHVITLFSLLLISSWQALAQTIHTILPTDPAVTLSGNWRPINSSHGLDLKSDDMQAIARVQLPSNTTAVSFKGLKRKDGATYGACIDCTDDNLLTIIDGNDSTGGDTRDPILLFSSEKLDPTVDHVLVVKNVPDSRFVGQSEIVFCSVDATVKDAGGSSSSSALPSSTASQWSLAAIPTNTKDPKPSTSTATSTPITESGTQAQPTPPTQSDSGSPTSQITSSPSKSTKSAKTHSPSSNSSADGLGSGEQYSTSAPSFRMSTVLVVVIAVSIIAVVAVLITVMLYLRIRRRQASRGSRLPDMEEAVKPPPASPVIWPSEMHDIVLDGEHPVNPFEDVAPALSHYDPMYQGPEPVPARRQRVDSLSSQAWVERKPSQAF